LQGGFEVFGEASVAVEPGESTFDNPTPRQEDELSGGIAVLGDIDLPAADLVEGGAELGPL
jgi:hypothetical protein